MARNFFRIFTENKPVRGLRKKYNIPEVNWLKVSPYFFAYGKQSQEIGPSVQFHRTAKQSAKQYKTDFKPNCIHFV